MISPPLCMSDLCGRLLVQVYLYIMGIRLKYAIKQ